MVSTVLRACCWAVLAVSTLGVEVTAQRGHHAGPPTVSTSSPNHGGHTTVPSRTKGSGRNAIRARSSRLALSRAGLSSRRLTPFAGSVYGGVYLPWDDIWSPAAMDEEQEEPPDLASIDAARMPLPPPVYAGPSSIQPLTPSSPQSAAPSSATGTLRFDVLPPNAQVYVDGFFVGAADALNDRGGLTASAGWHRMELRAPGYQTPAVNVTIEPGRTAAFRLALRPLL